MQYDLKNIKKTYGEKLAHLCRELFPTILENEGVLYNLLSVSFAPSKFLYDDLISMDAVYKFKDYIYSLYDVEKQEIITNKTPEQLLDEAGYKLYKCNSYDDIEKFTKYYAENEGLCTFDDKNRLDRCHVFFAVKKDVDNIKREDFVNPKRQDLYGTSVISIQFTKGKVNTLSIKNRYNHRVNNPDATFNNNLDNIIKGLTTSFEKKYNYNINSYDNRMYLPGYVLASDGKFYKYSYEINNIYYGPDNTIIDNFKVIDKYSNDKARYIVLDYFVLDLKEKRIIKYDEKSNDSFTDGLSNIDKIEVIKDQVSNKHILIQSNGNNIEIVISPSNQIIGYRNNVINEVGDNFLKDSTALENIELRNVKSIGNRFLYRNNYYLKHIDLENVEEVGDYFLFSDTNLDSIDFPNLKKIGDRGLYFSRVKSINMPNLEYLGNDCFRYNREVREFNFPNLQSFNRNSFINNDKYEEYINNQVNSRGGRSL